MMVIIPSELVILGVEVKVDEEPPILRCVTGVPLYRSPL